MDLIGILLIAILTKFDIVIYLLNPYRYLNFYYKIYYKKYAFTLHVVQYYTLKNKIYSPNIEYNLKHKLE